jgi:hypothetical protein
MNGFDDEHASGYESSVARGTYLNCMTDEHLIDELIKRKRLLVINAHRVVDRIHHDTPGLMEGAHAKLAEDIGKHLLLESMIAFEEEYNYRTRQMQYSADCIFLTPAPEERQS